ncbi:MAG: DUF3299 domain-containing protein [Verrucomicrobia bacterium]|nr:DUF3299 domain-containing protein [Verrucomicrobiota bacterium]
MTAAAPLILSLPLLAQTNSTPTQRGEVRGKPIQRLPATPAPAKAADDTRVTALDAPDARDGAFTILSFEKLSAYDYFVTEIPSLLEPERLVLRSTNSIPPQIKAYNGKRVSISGFVRPLRTQNRLVTEFLLLRDQGTCCFGSRAQMNHFVRVKLKGGGFSPGLPVPYKATGTLSVGEEYVGEFLTSIYSMDAEKVVPQQEDPTGL